MITSQEEQTNIRTKKSLRAELKKEYTRKNTHFSDGLPSQLDGFSDIHTNKPVQCLPSVGGLDASTSR